MKKAKYVLTVLAALTMAFAAPMAASAETETSGMTEDNTADEKETIGVPLTIVNETGVELHELYASPEGENLWGESILGEQTLKDSESGIATFTFTADTLVWDFAMADSEGNQIEFYGLDFTGGSIYGMTLILEYDGTESTATLTDTDLEEILTSGLMGLTESGEGFYYASSDDASLSIILIYNSESNNSASFVGPLKQESDTMFQIEDSNSQLTLAFEVIPQDNETFLLDLGDLGSATVAECEISEVLEAIEIIDAASTPVA